MDSLQCKSVVCLSFEHCLPFGHSVTKRTLEMVKEVSRQGHRHGQQFAGEKSQICLHLLPLKRQQKERCDSGWCQQWSGERGSDAGGMGWSRNGMELSSLCCSWDKGEGARLGQGGLKAGECR